jgi:hypothetical protein
MLKDQEMAIDSGEAKTQDFGTDFKGEFRYKSGISGKLEWERVNEITWKSPMAPSPMFRPRMVSG